LPVIMLSVARILVAVAVALFAGMNLYWAYCCVTRKDDSR